MVMTITMFACGEPQPNIPPTPISYADEDLRSILNLMESNKIAAESQYEDKYIRLSGRISEIGENEIDLIPAASDMFQMSGAECKLADSEKAKVVNLRKDQLVTVKGKVSGFSTFMINTVNLKKCLLE